MFALLQQLLESHERETIAGFRRDLLQHYLPHFSHAQAVDQVEDQIEQIKHDANERLDGQVDPAVIDYLEMLISNRDGDRFYHVSQDVDGHSASVIVDAATQAYKESRVKRGIINVRA